MNPGRQGRVAQRTHRSRARLGAAWLISLAFAAVGSPAYGQALTDDLFNPKPGGFAPKRSGLSPVAQPSSGGAMPGQSADPFQDDQPSVLPAPTRPWAPRSYGNPAGSGAAVTGYDSLGRKKAAKAKPGLRPGLQLGAGATSAPGDAARLTGNAALPPPPRGPVPSTPPKLTPPPSSTANMAPVAPAIADSVPGQPPRRRLTVDNDPFGAPGIYYGSFLSKAAVELSGGYDTNPARIAPARGSSMYVIAPELSVTSNWERHALSADLRGSYTGYGATIPEAISASSGAPTTLNRPDFTGKIDGRIDVAHDSRINTEVRLRVATDNPGSPNIQTGLARYPVYATTGATLGAEHDFNRFSVALNGTVDHTAYQRSQLNDGTSSSNDDRNFTQYGGIARASYDWRPGVKPFVESELDTRVHDVTPDRYGYYRNSNGGYLKGGSTFELTRLITGEAALGWSARTYQDPRLGNVSGLLTSGSLIWTATALTTAKFIATSSIDESPLPGVSGVLTNDYVWQVEHAFQRWLVATGRFGYGTSNYQELGRFDRRYTASADLVYKLNRTFAIKGQLRHDWLDSNVPGASTEATIITLGVRVQQ